MSLSLGRVLWLVVAYLTSSPTLGILVGKRLARLSAGYSAAPLPGVND